MRTGNGDPPPQEEAVEPLGLAGQVIRGAGFSAGGFAITQGLNLVAYVVLARLLVPEEFGVYAAATVLLGLALLVSESGMSAAVVQRRTRVDEAANTAFLATLLSGSALSVLALASAPLLGVIFGDDQVAAVAAAMAGVVLVNSTACVPNAMLQRRFSPAVRVVIEPTAMAAFAVAGIVAADQGLGVWALVIAQYTNAAIAVTLAWAISRWRPRPHLASIAMWREMVGYTRHVFTAAAIYNVGWQADSLVVGTGLGVAPLGQFRYGFRIATLPFAALLAAASYVLLPALARIAEDLERLQSAFVRALRAMLTVAFPLGFLLVPLGVPLALIVFGDVWREAGYAAAAMCAFPVGGALNSVVSETLKATGNARPLPLLNLAWIGGSLALMAAMLPFGFRAVAAAVSVGAVLGGLCALVVAQRTLGLPFGSLLAPIVPPAVAATVMALAMLPLEAALNTASHTVAISLALLVAQGALGLVLFTVVLRLLSRDAFSELTWLGGQLARRIRRA